MYTFKPPNKLDTYLIGKFPTGNTLYLIGKEAHNNWRNHKARIKITTLGGNQYDLQANQTIQAFEFYAIPNNWLELFKRDNQALLELFQDMWNTKPVAVKSEPTPNDYYIVKYNMPTWYIAKRSEYDGGKKEVPAMFWTSKDGKYPATVGTESAKGNPHRAYKFPQLSSEVKAELQKLNPERYKEWEEFYMKKYKNFQPLKPAMPTELPNPADDYIVVAAEELAIVQRSKFIEGRVQWVYQFNYGWKEKVATAKERGQPAWPYIKDWKNHKGIEAIYKKFKQYYSEVEQKKVTEKQSQHYYKEPVGWKPENVLTLSTCKGIRPPNWDITEYSAWSFIDKDYFESLKPGDLYSAAMWGDPTQFTIPRKKQESAIQYTVSDTNHSIRLQAANPKSYTIRLQRK
jgi:hypothetical protein